MGSSPRDLQKKQAQQSSVYEGVIKDLKNQITDLKKELQNNSANNVGMFTAEQVDADINKVVNETIKELTLAHKKELDQQKSNFEKLINVEKELLIDLKKQNKFLIEKVCKIKETNDSEILNKLTNLLTEATKKTAPGAVGSCVLEGSDRPEIRNIFVDPLESDVDNGLESHINIKETSVTQKGNVLDKVNKLKKLVGSLDQK